MLNARRRFRRDNVREYGYRYVGTEPANLDDGHDGREPLETGSHIPASEYKLPDWHESFRTAGT